jgi:hypothetical protein
MSRLTTGRPRHAWMHSYMLENNYGRILLIASIAGKEGNAGMCAYSTSKAGVIGLVKVGLACTSIPTTRLYLGRVLAFLPRGYIWGLLLAFLPRGYIWGLLLAFLP